MDMLLAFLLLGQQTLPGLNMLQTFDGPGHNVDTIYAACERPDGNLVYGGKVFTDLGSKFDYLTVALDYSGRKLWDKSYGPLKSGGDAYYKRIYLSQRFWRSDIIEDIAVDAENNVYCIGKSTVSANDKDVDFFPYLVVYSATGDVKYIKNVQPQSAKYQGFGAVKPRIAISGDYVAISTSLRKETGPRYTSVTTFNKKDGSKVGEKIIESKPGEPVALAALPNQEFVVYSTTGKIVDIAEYQYEGQSLPPGSSSWVSYRFNASFSSATLTGFDKRGPVIRGNGIADSSGNFYAITGESDGTDKITRWQNGRAVWRSPLENSGRSYYNPGKGGTSYYQHSRVVSELAVNSKSVFVGRAKSLISSQAIEVAVEAFEVQGGRKTGSYRHTNRGKPGENFVIQGLYASETKLLCGGNIGFDSQHQVDAWMGYWML